MTSVVALDRLLDARRVWRGQAIVAPATSQSTGHAALDAALPGGGWPEAALSEILLAAPGTHGQRAKNHHSMPSAKARLSAIATQQVTH